MKVKVHCIKRNERNQPEELLMVTSEAEYYEATLSTKYSDSNSREVISFSAGITRFKRVFEGSAVDKNLIAPQTALYIKQDVFDHFVSSVAPFDAS